MEELKIAGNDAFNNKEYVKALDLYTRAISLSEDQPSAALFSNRSQAFLLSGDPTRALEDAKACIQLDPTWWKAYARLGSALEALDRHRESLAAYERALALDRNSQKNVQLRRARDEVAVKLANRKPGAPNKTEIEHHAKQRRQSYIEQILEDQNIRRDDPNSAQSLIKQIGQVWRHTYATIFELIRRLEKIETTEAGNRHSPNFDPLVSVKGETPRAIADAVMNAFADLCYCILLDIDACTIDLKQGDIIRAINNLCVFASAIFKGATGPGASLEEVVKSLQENASPDNEKAIFLDDDRYQACLLAIYSRLLVGWCGAAIGVWDEAYTIWSSTRLIISSCKSVFHERTSIRQYTSDSESIANPLASPLWDSGLKLLVLKAAISANNQSATEQLAEDCCNAATQLVQLNADNKDAKNTSQMPRSLRMMVGRLCATAAKCLCPAKYTVKELYNRAAAKMWLLQDDPYLPMDALSSQ